MRKCLFADQIDDYLLNKLEGEAKEQFEEHYFNCPNCFREMEERDALISTIKSQGARLFRAPAASERRDWVPAWKRALSSFSYRQWATVGVAAAAILLVVFGVLPRFRGSSPQFVLSDTEVVRGESLALMSPVIDVRSVPTFFEWKALAQEAEYRISLYNGGLLWSATTRDNRIVVPEETRRHMLPGQRFAWQVKAYSSHGTLIAVSSKVQFEIKPAE
jgi:Putative zinc-finger